MRELLTSGAVGNIELNAQKKIRQDIQERWQKLHLVDGLQGHIQETVATLYENQAKHLISEATAADNSGSFETVVFPLIRRIFSKLLAIIIFVLRHRIYTNLSINIYFSL